MPDKRIVQAGHLLAMVFVALLLVGAREYLAVRPILAGALLAVFAFPYWAAARITGYRQFLYPAVLLPVLAFHLFLHGAGLAPAAQPLAALVPVAVVGMLALYGANALLILVMALWILFRLAWFYDTAPLAAALALAGFALYYGFRFRGAGRMPHALAMAVLGSGGYLFLLYRYPRIALVLAAAAALRLAGALFFRRAIPWLEGLAYVLAGIYLLAAGVAASPEVAIPFGYLALGGAWLQLGLLLNRPEQPALMGPAPATLPPLLPVLGAGTLLALAPAALFYPWKPAAAAVAYLAIFSLLFLAAAREMGEHAVGLAGAVLARLFAGLGRIAPAAALAYIAAAGFPGDFGVAAAACGLGLLSLLWAWREEPKLLRRRNYFAYQAGVFLITAYFLAERRFGAAGLAETLLGSGALAILALFAIGGLLGRRAPAACRMALFEAASVAAIAAALVYPLRGPTEWFTAGLLGFPVMLVSGAGFAAAGEVSALFSIPVVLGLWLYVAEWLFGIRGEWLGVPYLLLNFAWAAAGYALLRRASRWHPVLYFMWLLSVAVALLLFAPFQAIGAWAVSLAPLGFVLVARAEASRRDRALAWGLEAAGAFLAAGIAAVLLWNHLYGPAAFAFFADAALYAWVAARYRLWPYLYPSALCAVAGFHLGMLEGGRAALSLPYFLPIAAAFYVIALLLRRRGEQRFAFPLELAASAGAVTGAAILLAQPFDRLGAATGALSGLAYAALYGLLVRYGGDRAFLTGIGLSGALAFYELLPALSGVTPENRLAFLIPSAWVLAALGWQRRERQDARGSWALYAAAITIAAATSLFVLLPAGSASGAAARVVLVGALAVWVALLLWTGREIFIYCATLVLAMLAYHFVQSSSDLFGRHLVSFFLWGTALLGIVFLAAVGRNFVRFRRPALLVATGRARHYIYALPVALLGLATFGAWGVDTSSNPVFCGSCHEMRAYFGNWQTSAHAKSEVGCPTCHYEPGLRGYARAKMQGLSELVISLTGTQSPKPEARVNDENCLRSGCHSLERLAGTRYARHKFYFDHATHLRGEFLKAGLAADAGPWRGPELRCTSCHTDVSPESHFAVDTNACVTCHFTGGSEPRPAVAGVGCVTCHAVPEGARGADGFDHSAAGVAANDEACGACHSGLTEGAATVEERRCRHCHLERPATLLAAGAGAIHQRHVRGRGVACDWCHDEIRHRLEPARETQPVAAAARSMGGN